MRSVSVVLPESMCAEMPMLRVRSAEAGAVEAAATALENAPTGMVEASKPLREMRSAVLPEAAKKAANALFVAKDYAGALPLYSLAVSLTDATAHVYLSNRSACYQALRKWEAALADARARTAAESAARRVIRK